MADPRVSIILPTLNGARDLARLLPALVHQRYDDGFEICAIDSDSSDNTIQLLSQVGARIGRIRRADFRHGATRNRAASQARGEFLVFLSQDAAPAGDDFLTRIVEAFEDPEVAGVAVRILASPFADPLTTRTALAHMEASDESWDLRLDGRDLTQVEPLELVQTVRFNNVASAIRASVFQEIPLPDVPFGEDVAWAEAALAAGYRIVFTPHATVNHAHRYKPREAYERYKLDAAFHRVVHGHRLRPSLWSILRGIAYELREDVRYVARRGGWGHLLRAPALRTAQVLGQFAGSRGWGKPTPFDTHRRGPKEAPGRRPSGGAKRTTRRTP